MAHKDDQTVIATTHNTARYFTEKRQVAWVALAGTIIWGVIGFFAMPQRKDPDIPALSALVITPWPGMDAERVEERVTRRIEEVVAENDHVDVVRSTTRTGVSYVFIDLKEGTKGTGEIFDDIGLKLSQIHDLPDGAGPIQYIKDFGSTAALMLTVASPRIDEVQVSLRADEVTIASGTWPIAASASPTRLESSCPRLAKGRSKSVGAESAASALAWRRRRRVFIPCESTLPRRAMGIRG